MLTVLNVLRPQALIFYTLLLNDFLFNVTTQYLLYPIYKSPALLVLAPLGSETTPGKLLCSALCVSSTLALYSMVEECRSSNCTCNLQKDRRLADPARVMPSRFWEHNFMKGWFGAFYRESPIVVPSQTPESPTSFVRKYSFRAPSSLKVENDVVR